MDTDPNRVAATAILRGLRAKEGIDLAEDEALLDEIAGFLERRTNAMRAIAEGMPIGSRWSEFVDTVEAKGDRVDDDAVAPLAEALASLLTDSAHVEELYLDDEALYRILHAALFDFVSEERRALALAIPLPAPKSVGQKPRGPITLADEGFPFPLFDAPRTLAVLDDAGPCAVCGLEARVRFKRACYACFRGGKVTHSVDTELGMVFSQSAALGFTHGLPDGVPHPEGHVERVTEARNISDEKWVAFGVEPSALIELTRTPVYSTWQGEHWLFCCLLPMKFVGTLDHASLFSLDEKAPEAHLATLLDIGAEEATERADDVMANRITVYAFRCGSCGRERAHWDRS